MRDNQPEIETDKLRETEEQLKKNCPTSNKLIKVNIHQMSKGRIVSQWNKNVNLIWFLQKVIMCLNENISVTRPTSESVFHFLDITLSENFIKIISFTENYVCSV